MNDGMGNSELFTDLMEHGDPVLGHVDVDDGPRLHEELPQQRVAHLLVQTAHVDGRILGEQRSG